jgi:hypothetical protein
MNWYMVKFLAPHTFIFTSILLASCFWTLAYVLLLNSIFWHQASHHQLFIGISLIVIHLANDTHGTTKFEGPKYLQTYLHGQIFSPSFVVLEKFSSLFPNPQMTWNWTLLIKLQTSISSQQDWIHLQLFLLTCQDATVQECCNLLTKSSNTDMQRISL